MGLFIMNFCFSIFAVRLFRRYNIPPLPFNNVVNVSLKLFLGLSNVPFPFILELVSKYTP
jgi:hypothetical protein